MYSDYSTSDNIVGYSEFSSYKIELQNRVT